MNRKSAVISALLTVILAGCSQDPSGGAESDAGDLILEPCIAELPALPKQSRLVWLSSGDPVQCGGEVHRCSARVSAG